MDCLSPSLLSANFAELGKQVALLDKAGTQYVHIDVMDGIFVPSISMGLPIIKSIRPKSKRIFDVHLMIEEPIRYIDDFADAEACRHLDRTIQKIKEKIINAGANIIVAGSSIFTGVIEENIKEFLSIMIGII